MSIRSSSSLLRTPQQSAPIEFKSEFTNSPAALAANHEESVAHILTRLDQLQASISGGETAPAAAATTTKSTIASRVDPNDLHARLAALESVHEDTLHQLGAKLSLVEQKLRDNKEAESLMGQISSKFSLIESRMHSQSKLHDRVSDLETKLHPSPEDERTIARINAKLDLIEDRQRMRARRDGDLESMYEPPRRSYEPRVSSRYERYEEPRRYRGEEASLGGRFRDNGPSVGGKFRPEDAERAEFLQERIQKLEALRARYNSDGEEDED